MPLCGLCENFPFFNLPPFPPWFFQHLPVEAELLTVYGQRLNGNTEGLPLGIPHHKSLQELLAAAATCEMCALIESGVSKTLADFRTLEAEEGEHLTPIGEPTGELWVCRRREGEDGFLVLSPASKSEESEVLLVSGAGFCVDDESPLAIEFRGRRVDQDPRTPATIDRLCKWVQTCFAEHDHVKPTEVILPSRVLDLGDPFLGPSTIKLRETHGEMGKYVSLSHCWGSSRQSLTTTANLEKQKSGIEVNELPQTFQDAIFITIMLGLRYLWIDSLCIIQDDNDDWRRESGKMTEVYMNAYLTISAARSPDDATGFLSPRIERRYVNLPYATSEVTGDVLAFAIPIHIANDGWQYVALTQEPLTTRAWSLQERYLSHRCLHFSSSQAAFECKSHFLTEDGYNHGEPLNYLGELDPPRVDREFTSRGSPSWRHIVREYSSRKLTYASDKLPALAGLAGIFERRVQVTKQSDDNLYVAGLWQDNMIEDLCWQTMGGRAERPSAYRAPSWSWTSLDGEIALPRLSTHEDIAELEDVQVGHVGDNHFGQVCGGWVRLKSILLPLRWHTWEWDTPENDERRWYVRNFTIDGFDSADLSIAFDIGDEARAFVEQGGTEQLYAVVMVYTARDPAFPKDKRSSALGLAVKKSSTESKGGSGNAFQRLGRIYLYHHALVDSFIARKQKGEVESITLV